MCTLVYRANGNRDNTSIGSAMGTTTITIRLNQEDKDLIKAYAEINRKSVASIMLESVLDRIEDEMDIKLYEQAKAEFVANPVTYSLDEAEQILGIG